jgi:hypothetical protein
MAINESRQHRTPDSINPLDVIGRRRSTGITHPCDDAIDHKNSSVRAQPQGRVIVGGVIGHQLTDVVDEQRRMCNRLHVMHRIG